MSENSIGPFYRIVGVLVLVVGLGIQGVRLSKEGAVGWPDVALLLGNVLVALFLIRPPGFDDFLKTVADRLPFLSYRKPE